MWRPRLSGLLGRYLGSTWVHYCRWGLRRRYHLHGRTIQVTGTRLTGGALAAHPHSSRCSSSPSFSRLFLTVRNRCLVLVPVRHCFCWEMTCLTQRSWLDNGNTFVCQSTELLYWISHISYVTMTTRILRSILNEEVRAVVPQMQCAPALFAQGNQNLIDESSSYLECCLWSAEKLGSSGDDVKKSFRVKRRAGFDSGIRSPALLGQCSRNASRAQQCLVLVLVLVLASRGMRATWHGFCVSWPTLASKQSLLHVPSWEKASNLSSTNMRLASACRVDGHFQYWRNLVGPHEEGEEQCARWKHRTF